MWCTGAILTSAIRQYICLQAVKFYLIIDYLACEQSEKINYSAKNSFFQYLIPLNTQEIPENMKRGLFCVHALARLSAVPTAITHSLFIYGRAAACNARINRIRARDKNTKPMMKNGCQTMQQLSPSRHGVNTWKRVFEPCGENMGDFFSFGQTS